MSGGLLRENWAATPTDFTVGYGKMAFILAYGFRRPFLRINAALSKHILDDHMAFSCRSSEVTQRRAIEPWCVLYVNLYV